MQKYLLPHRWKYAGMALTFLGILSSIFYMLSDFRFKMPVFAVYSSFLETKYFTAFQTNFTEELVLILLISGFSLLIFSKDKHESIMLDLIRLKAFFKALAINTFLLFFSVLFIFGSGFMVVLIINILSFNLLYLLFFYIMKRKDKELISKD